MWKESLEDRDQAHKQDESVWGVMAEAFIGGLHGPAVFVLKIGEKFIWNTFVNDAVKLTLDFDHMV